jgi:hypothetical protein
LIFVKNEFSFRIKWHLCQENSCFWSLLWVYFFHVLLNLQVRVILFLCLYRQLLLYGTLSINNRELRYESLFQAKMGAMLIFRIAIFKLYTFQKWKIEKNDEFQKKKKMFLDSVQFTMKLLSFKFLVFKFQLKKIKFSAETLVVQL